MKKMLVIVGAACALVLGVGGYVDADELTKMAKSIDTIWILVDPGSGIAEEQVLVEIRRLGRGLEDVTFCLITQCHADHCLGAYRLQGLGT